MGVLQSISSYLFGKKEMKFLMVGLDAAGKTTLLYRMKMGTVVKTTQPTADGFNVETVKYKNITFRSWDVGVKTHEFRSVWKQYLSKTHGIIFVIDSNDRTRLGEAKDELNRMLQEDELRDAVLLIFSNKKDLPCAMTVSEITDELGLQTLGNRKWHVEASYGGNGDGLYEGLDWLSTQLNIN